MIRTGLLMLRVKMMVGRGRDPAARGAEHGDIVTVRRQIPKRKKRAAKLSMLCVLYQIKLHP